MESTPMSNMLLPPEQCTQMAEVRRAIDALDQDVIALLSERMRYIDAAARIKTARETVRDEERKAEVIARVVKSAEQLGFPADLAASLYDQLVEYSIAHELDRFDERARSA